MMTDIFLSDKAFIGMILSAIEVYKRECLGALLGYNLRKRIVVEYAIPYQTAKRKPTEVETNWSRERKVHEILPKVLHLQHVGYFHSHPQRGDQKASPRLTDVDIRSMMPCQIEIVIAVNDAKRRTKWGEGSYELHGTIGKYNIRIAGYYKTRDGKIRKYRLLCPYILGFDYTFEE